MAGIKFGLTTISVVIFALYIGNSFHTLYNVFHPKLCDPNINRKDCVFPQLEPDKNGNWPPVGLRIFISDSPYPSSSSRQIFKKDDLKVNEEFEQTVEVKLPAKSRRNGTLWAHAVLLSTDDRFKEIEDAETRITRTTLLTVYQIPEAEAFKLVSDEKETKMPVKKSRRPVSHLRSTLFISIVDQPLILPIKNLPSEVIQHIQMEIREGIHYYSPLFHIDEMSYRIKDLVEVSFVLCLCF
uniref:Uncharacterized protein n=1 Tax=Panagrolaimus sp. ES5 TaxID=591445 RepID=A0AC34F358_9BILA